VRSTVSAARRLVREVAPNAKEIAYQGGPPRSARSMWKLFRYSIAAENGEYVVGLGTYPDHVCVFFPAGKELDDQTGLLEGGGKHFRYLTLRRPADANRPEIKRIMRRAFDLAKSRILG
jgi:hypothetical protein